MTFYLTLRGSFSADTGIVYMPACCVTLFYRFHNMFWRNSHPSCVLVPHISCMGHLGVHYPIYPSVWNCFQLPQASGFYRNNDLCPPYCGFSQASCHTRRDRMLPRHLFLVGLVLVGRRVPSCFGIYLFYTVSLVCLSCCTRHSLCRTFASLVFFCLSVSVGLLVSLIPTSYSFQSVYRLNCSDFVLVVWCP